MRALLNKIQYSKLYKKRNTSRNAALLYQSMEKRMLEKQPLDHNEIMRHCSAITWQYDHGDLAELSRLDSSDQYLLKQKIIGCMVSLWAIMNGLGTEHENKEDIAASRQDAGNSPD